MNKETLKKLAAFFCTCAGVVGALGGTIVAAVNGSGFIAFCVAALGAMAVPFILKLWKDDPCK